MTEAKARDDQAAVAGNGIGDDAGGDDGVDLGYVPRTELGRLALAARREFLAANGRFLTRVELEREIAERRGGTHLHDLDDR